MSDSGEIVYKASDWQNRYHARTEFELLGGGSAGPGKSICLLMDPMQQVHIEHARCSDKRHKFHQAWGASTGCALFLRREFPMLEETIRRSKRIFPRIDPKADYKSSDYTWTFSSGFRYRFGHCHDTNDWEKYYSDEYSEVMFDEARQFALEQYEQISTRVRSSDPVLRKMLKVRSMTNPGPCLDKENPQWIRERFVDPHPEGNMVLKKTVKLRNGDRRTITRLYMPATLYDNPDKEFVAEYEVNLLSRPPHIRQLLLYGNWYAALGAFFAEDWTPDIHIVSPFEIPSDWPVFRAMDWGYRTHGVIGWFAQDYDGNLFCIHEFSFRELTATEVALAAREWERSRGYFKNGKSLLSGPADTQLWERRGDSGVSKAEEFLRCGMRWEKADKSSRQRNAEHVTERLKGATKGSGKGLFFFKNCRKCIQTIPVIGVNENNTEEPEKGGEDHWYDMVSYGCNYASRGVKGMSRKVVRDEDDDWELDYSRRGQGQYGYGF